MSDNFVHLHVHSEFSFLDGYGPKRVSGVYCAIHRASLRCYVGSSIDIRKRWRGHAASARDGSRTCFHKALKKFGVAAFDFEILELCSKDRLLEREEFWIVFLGAATLNGFNTKDKPTATYDTKLSKATRQRMSEWQRGRTLPKDTRERIGEWQRGRKFPQRKAKMQAWWNKDREAKVANISAKMKASWTPERKRKASELAKRMQAEWQKRRKV